MYGLVNKGIEELICSRFGDDTWHTIKQQAGVEIDVFISMEAYPDEVSYRLVGAASEVLGLTPDALLQAFGEYWIQFPAKEGYGGMLDMAGHTLPEFLQSLDTLHTRVGLSFPQLQPPSFQCTDIREDSMRLHYHSTRPGLTPLVIGLLQGLARRFETAITVTQACDRSQGADHDEFVLTFGRR